MDCPCFEGASNRDDETRVAKRFLLTRRKLKLRWERKEAEVAGRGRPTKILSEVVSVVKAEIEENADRGTPLTKSELFTILRDRVRENTGNSISKSLFERWWRSESQLFLRKAKKWEDKRKVQEKILDTDAWTKKTVEWRLKTSGMLMKLVSDGTRIVASLSLLKKKICLNMIKLQKLKHLVNRYMLH